MHFSNFDVGLCQQRLSRGRGARRARVRLAHRPDRAPETVLHHAGAVSHRNRGHRAVVECGELRAVSVSHRRRHRRRIYRDQFDDTGIGAGALSRLDRPCDQRQLLDRRGDGRDQRHRPARSRSDRARSRLAVGLSHRRLPRPDRVCDADVDPGKPALADDPRPSRAGRCDRGGYRTIGHRTCAGPESACLAEDQTADARPHAAARGGAHAVLAPTGSARWSGWR